MVQAVSRDLPAGRLARAVSPRVGLDLGPRRLLLACGIVVGLLVLAPVVFLLRTSLTQDQALQASSLTLDHYRFVLASSQVPLVVTTVVFAAGSGVIALLLGGTTAWLYARTNAALREAAFVAAFVSLSMPLTVKVIGWILLLGPQAGLVNVLLMSAFGLDQPPLNLFSLGGMAALQGMLWSSVVFLLTVGSLATMDPSLEEAALVSGASRFTVIRRISLPLATPALLGVLLLAFVSALETLEVPLMVGQAGKVVVLSTQIFQSTRQGFVPEYGEASAFAVVLMLLVGLALIPYHRVAGGARRFSTISGKGFRAARIDLGVWRYPAAAWMLLMPLFLLAPIAMMAWASLLRYYTPPTPQALSLLTADNYPAALVLPNLQAAVRTSAIASTGSATLVALLTLLVAWAIARGGSALGGMVDFLASVPLVIPGIVLGLAVMQMFLVLPIPIYGTVAILIFAFLIRYLPYGMRYSHPAVLAIHPELEEAARTSGAGTPTVLGRVVLPLALPSLAALWIYVVLISVRELSMSVLLSGAQTPVVSLAVLELWQSGQITVVAAFSCMLVVVLTVLALIFLRLTRRYGFFG